MKEVILPVYLSIYRSLSLSLSIYLSIYLYTCPSVQVYKWAFIGFVQKVFVGYMFTVQYTLLGIGLDDKDYLITLVDTWFVFWR